MRTKKNRKKASRLGKALLFVATTKWSAKKQKGYEQRRLGKFGPASEVKHIDPRTWERERSKTWNLSRNQDG